MKLKLSLTPRSFGSAPLAKSVPLLVGTTLLTFAAQANTQQIKMPQFERLEKLTVGPDNHFQVAVSSSEDKIFFTRSTNLASRLYWRGLQGYQALGQVNAFEDAVYDSKDPSLSPDASRIAFTSFEKQARGDVCVKNVQSGIAGVAVCAGETVASEQPFWMSSTKIGYIRRPAGALRAQLISFDLNSKEKAILFEDQILSADAHPLHGKIIYSSILEGKSKGNTNRGVLKVFSLENQSTKVVGIALPGLSGFPKFDVLGEFVYFAQFSNDTNADSVIDGNDNGVIFRIPSAKLNESSTAVMPEQLTTSEQNCNFPAPGRNALYVTCAFEGTLDVYRMPKTGLVPASWQEAHLLDAYKTSRTIAERTLITNTLRHRFPDYQKLESIERLMSQHILTGEYQAAQYYLGQVEPLAPAAQREGFAILSNLLEVLHYRSVEKLDQVSPEFLQLLRQKKSFFERVSPAYKSFAQVALAFVDLSARQPQLARKKFDRVNTGDLRSSLEILFYLNLAKTLLEADQINHTSWFDAVVRVAEGAVISDESKAYLASQVLLKLSQLEKGAVLRAGLIESLLKNVRADSVFDVVLRSQLHLLQLAQTNVVKDEDRHFGEFNKILAKTGKRYYLRRVVSIQGVLTLAEFNKTRVMNFVDSNWLSAASIYDTEYVKARDQYVSVVLDKSYSLWAEKQLKPASQVFYSAVRLTDDQEAHLGFVSTLLLQNERKLLDERYESLKKAGLNAANLEFARAAMLLADDASRSQREDVSVLEQAEKILTSLKDDGSRPAGKHSLLGFIYHQKVLRRADGFQFDSDLIQKAHHQYLVALDLARSSNRMSARILQNLALLHSQTGNYGLASGYFLARQKLGFESKEQQLTFLGLFSKALYRNGEFVAAAERSSVALQIARELKKSAAELLVWTERNAFYLSQASNFKNAAEVYEQVLKLNTSEDENRVKALLMAGWSYWKSGERKRGADYFDKTISLSNKLKPRAARKEPGQVLGFQPDRYRLIAYGFLAQLGTTPAARMPLRAERIKTLDRLKDRLDEFGLSRENWSRFVLKDCVSQEADRWSSSGVLTLNTCLSLAREFVDAGVQPADEMMIETLRVSWQLLASTRQKANAPDLKANQNYFDLSRRALSGLDALAGASRPMANRWLKLRADSLAARHLLLTAGQNDYISRADAVAELERLSNSERLELLSADEREQFSRHLDRTKKLVAQLGRRS